MNARHTKEQEKYKSSMLYVHKSDESYVVSHTVNWIYKCIYHLLAPKGLLEDLWPMISTRAIHLIPTYSIGDNLSWTKLN